MKKLLLLSLVCPLLFCNCMVITSQRGEFDIDRVAMSGTNTGGMTTTVQDENAKVNPIPLLGGMFSDNTVKEVWEAEQETTIKAGRIEITGVIDQASGITAFWKGAKNFARTIVTGQVLKAFSSDYTTRDVAGTDAGVTKQLSKDGSGLAKHQSDNRLKTIEAVGEKGMVPIKAIESP